MNKRRFRVHYKVYHNTGGGFYSGRAILTINPEGQILTEEEFCNMENELIELSKKKTTVSLSECLEIVFMVELKVTMGEA